MEQYYDATGNDFAAALHSVFGLGEDWNDNLIYSVVILIRLHSVFGLGEDWN